MFHLTSASAKIAILTLSVLSAVGGMDTLVHGFHHPSSPSVVVALPSVTIVGHRSNATEPVVQTASGRSANPSI